MVIFATQNFSSFIRIIIIIIIIIIIMLILLSAVSKQNIKRSTNNIPTFTFF